MPNRLTAAFVLTCVIPLAAAAQEGQYPPGAYQQQQQPGYPQQYPQQQYPQQQQLQPQYPYPQPGAAMDPAYGPSPLAAGYVDPAGEPLVSSVKGALQLSL